jgi:hypothetical protein
MSIAIYKNKKIYLKAMAKAKVVAGIRLIGAMPKVTDDKEMLSPSKIWAIGPLLRRATR